MSLIRPVCGIDHAAEETLSSSFRLNWPTYEVIFCAADAQDPVLPILERLCAEHPHVSARILVGRTARTGNPKLDNCAKGWASARHDWIVMADSNLLLTPDYLIRIMAAVRPGVGAVSAPPIGSDPRTFWAEVECSMLNSFQARVQYTVDALGLGFAQGKTLAVQRSTLERAGGYRALAQAPAEDAALTKVVRALGLRVALARPPLTHPLGARSARAVWGRHVRWARLRRATFPLLYGPEVLAGPVVPSIALAFAAPTILPTYLAIWYAAELMLAKCAGWPLSPATIPASVVRDVMLPLQWLAGLFGRDVSWRGHAVELDARSADARQRV